MQNLKDVAKINEDDVVNTLNEDANQGVGECLLEQEQIHTEVHEERKEIPVLDKTRVDNTQSSKEGFEEKLFYKELKERWFSQQLLSIKVKP